MARRLMGLPLLRSHLLSGRLSWSMVDLLVRVAVPEDEAEWIARAADLDVRGLRALLKMRRLAAGDGRRPRVSIATRVDRVDAWAFEQARIMVEALGAAPGDEAIEALLAEGLGALLAREPDLDLPRGIAGDDTPASPTVDSLPAPVDDRWAARTGYATGTDAPEAPEVVDARLRQLAGELGRRDLELGRLAQAVDDARAWRDRGYASFDDYCRGHIGLSPTSVVTRMVLARRLAGLPAIGAALEAGRIGCEAASLIARVASEASAHAWIERAETRTVKHLREEVDAVELLARANGHPVTRHGPPSAALLEEVQAVERHVIATVTGQDESPGQMSAAVETSVPLTQEVTLRFTVGESVGQFWRALERLYEQMSGGVGESFVAFLVRATTATWRDSQPTQVAYADVYLRDRWRCASPVCRSRNVTPHHIQFRSQGGSDDRTNLVSLCERCHLDLVHGSNTLRLTGPHHHLTWHTRTWQVEQRSAHFAGRLATAGAVT